MFVFTVHVVFVSLEVLLLPAFEALALASLIITPVRGSHNKFLKDLLSSDSTLTPLSLSLIIVVDDFRNSWSSLSTNLFVRWSL